MQYLIEPSQRYFAAVDREWLAVVKRYRLESCPTPLLVTIRDCWWAVHALAIEHLFTNGVIYFHSFYDAIYNYLEDLPEEEQQRHCDILCDLSVREHPLGAQMDDYLEDGQSATEFPDVFADVLLTMLPREHHFSSVSAEVVELMQRTRIDSVMYVEILPAKRLVQVTSEDA